MFIDNADWNRLSGFKTFVEGKDPNESYCYSNSQICACGQYLKSREEFTPDWLSDPEMKGLNNLAGGELNELMGPQWTFGKLLDRINAKEKELA